MGYEEPSLLLREFKDETIKDYTFNLTEERIKIKKVSILSIQILILVIESEHFEVISTNFELMMKEKILSCKRGKMAIR